MKLEIKILFLLVGFLLIAQPALLNAKVLKSGDQGYKEPLIALILSLVLPGLGHIWVGETTKGLMYLGVFLCLWLLIVILFFWVFIAYVLFIVWVAVDAMNTAKKYNERGGKISLLDNYRPATAAVY